MKNNGWLGLLVGIAMVVGMGLSGCDSGSLSREQTVSRAEFSDETLAREAPSGAGTQTPGLPDTGTATGAPAGTYHFTVPETVTRLQRSGGAVEQYSLYEGRPAPTDKPFVVISVGRTFTAEAEDPASGYQPTQKRSYLLHGLLVTEWTGFTKDGLPFNEMLVRHDAQKGDQLHALAVVRNDSQRALALDVLGSLEWTAGR